LQGFRLRCGSEGKRAGCLGGREGSGQREDEGQGGEFAGEAGVGEQRDPLVNTIPERADGRMIWYATR